MMDTIDTEISAISAADQVSAFTNILFQPHEIVELRFIKPIAEGNTNPKARPIITSTWLTARELSTPERVELIARTNSLGFNVYVGMNPRKERDVRGDANAALARSLSIDQDPANGFTSIEALIDHIAAVGLPEATAIVSSGNGVWGYWQLDEPITDMRVWTDLQKRLAALLGTDSTISNPERIVRLPGFTNWKPGKPKSPAWLWANNPTLAYPVSIFTALPEAKKAAAPKRNRDSSPPDTHADLIRRARVYVAKADGTGEGGRNNKIFNLAGNVAALVDQHGETLAEAEIVDLVAAFNTRCTPPLDTRELEKVVRSALTNGLAREPKPATSSATRKINAALALRGREFSNVA